MKDTFEKHQRRSIRLKEYDYSNEGAYFVTIVSHNRMNIFGSIHHGRMNLNQTGKIVENTWLEIPSHYPYVQTDAYVIVPNHIHGILIFESVGATHEVSRIQRQGSPLHAMPQPIKRQPLDVIVGSFKSAATKHIHRVGYLTQKTIWQRNYYEHIVRDDEDYQRIVEYFEMNPSNWELDNENLEKRNNGHP